MLNASSVGKEVASSIAYNLSADFIFLGLAAGWSLVRKFARRAFWVSRICFVAVLVSLTIAFGMAFFTIGKLGMPWYWLAIAASVYPFLVVVLVLRQFGQAWRVGIVGADYKVRDGINYARALDLCRDSFRFMGIGATKLVDEPGFSQCLVRCTHETPIQFLLLRPSNTLLVQAAMRASRDRDEYKDKVLHSLRIIAEMKQKRGLNIEVRFYENDPLFRLMFIDDMLCLASYYVMGEGDGSQLPQMHLSKRPFRRRSVGSFFHAFDSLYKREWQNAETWDFQKYV